jgi:hypothetical protein
MFKVDMVFWFLMKLGVSADLFALLFIYLKLTGTINWSWPFVLLPIALYVIVFSFGLKYILHRM